jgi:hypothetical protein
VQRLNEVPTAAQVADLGPLRSAAVYAGVLDAAGGAELVRLLLDLHRQLPRGRQAQYDRPIAGLCTTALHASRTGQHSPSEALGYAASSPMHQVKNDIVPKQMLQWHTRGDPHLITRRFRTTAG